MAWKLGIIILMLAAHGCATTNENNNENIKDLVLNAPEPKSDEERKKECSFLRDMISRAQGVYDGCTLVARDGFQLLLCRQNARNHITLAETRAANIGCTASFSNTQAQQKVKMSFDQCFERCKQLTDRTKEQCFDSCK